MVIYETHGDVCRVGYLRVVACLADDRIPKTFDYLASQLYEVARQRDKIKRYDVTGIIASNVNARNYVILAAETGIIDRHTQKRAAYGSIYAQLESAKRINDIIDGRVNAEADDFITLTQAEKIFFMHILIEHDHPFLGEIILWALKQRRFNRTTAMNYIMEDIYPEALAKSLQTASSKKRDIIRKEIDDAERFKDRRLSYSSQAEWIRTRQYAKYRHVAPPRLEWLVDLSILNREGRGKFSINPEIARMGYELERVLRLPMKKMREELFTSIYPYLGNWSKADQEEIAKTIVEGYHRFVYSGVKQVKLEVLEMYACFRLLERGMITTPNTVHQVFNSLTIKYPDKVFITPTTGEVEIAEDSARGYTII